MDIKATHKLFFLAKPNFCIAFAVVNLTCTFGNVFSNGCSFKHISPKVCLNWYNILRSVYGLKSYSHLSKKFVLFT